MFGANLILFLGVIVSIEGEDAECWDVVQKFLDDPNAGNIGTYYIKALEKRIESLRGDIKNSNTNSGTIITYVRWGRTECPQDADLVYSGWVGGSFWTHAGAAAEPLCLPKDPEWGLYTDGADGNNGYIYGAEYETNYMKDSRKDLHDDDVPCVVCSRRGKSAVTMIPAKKTCQEGWSIEYSGYLMSRYYGHAAAGKYTCVDSDPETLPGGHANKNGYLFYKVEGKCGSLKCPPYFEGREITCVICSI